jgi:hypothetical protein
MSRMTDIDSQGRHSIIFIASNSSYLHGGGRDLLTVLLMKNLSFPRWKPKGKDLVEDCRLNREQDFLFDYSMKL